MLYEQKDLVGLTQLLHRFYRNLILACIIPVLMAVAALIWRIPALGYTGAVIVAIVSTVLWYGLGYRIHCYRLLVKDILECPERETVGLVTTIGEKNISRQGSTFAPVELYCEDLDRKSKERIVFFDILKGKVPMAVGDRVKLILFDNIIKGVEIIE